MAMKETVRSLLAYFILSGLASLWFGFLSLAIDRRAPISPATILATAIGIVGVALALAFLYVGGFLPGLLRSSSSRIIAPQGLPITAGVVTGTCDICCGSSPVGH